MSNSFATPRTVIPQAPLSIGFSRQEYCSRLLCPFRGNLPDPQMESESVTSPALAGGFFTTEPPCTTYINRYISPVYLSYVSLILNPAGKTLREESKKLYPCKMLRTFTDLCVCVKSEETKIKWVFPWQFYTYFISYFRFAYKTYNIRH